MGRFYALDGLRGVAALAVMCFHLPGVFEGLFPETGRAVDLFFMLSGFVLANAYSAKLSGAMTTLRFVQVRAVRLFPLYLFGTAIGVAVALVHVIKGWSPISLEDVGWSVLLSAFMLPSPIEFSYLSYFPFPFNDPAWSLFFEMFVNIGFAAAFAFLTRPVLAAVLWVSAALLIGMGFHYGEINTGWNYQNFEGGFARVIFPFFAGVALHRLWSRRVFRLSAPGWFLATLLIALFSVDLDGMAKIIFELVCVLALFPVIILLGANAVVRGVQRQLLELSGQVSYAVYALHVPLWRFADLALQSLLARDLASFGVVGTVAMALFICTFAFVADKLFDAPVRRALMRWLTPVRDQAPG